MEHLSVTALGADRPGIVAGVTGALVALGANLEDTAMTVLRGRFVMVMVVAVPADVGADAVAGALAATAEELGLVVHVDALAADAAAAAAAAGVEVSITVHGADRPGIVHRVASALAGRGASIAEVSTRVLGAADGSVAYAMLLDVVVPVDEVDGVEADLAAASTELGVTCHCRRADADVL